MLLSKRLQRIADYIRPGSRIIDVGTDHAYIPIWLLLNQIAVEATATDIRSGPLERARQDAERYGVADRLKLTQCDGLLPFRSDDADTIIIAGMGGETIAGILDASPWALQKRLILQPQTKQDELRTYLGAHACSIADASLVDDTGRIYLIWLVQPGTMPPFSGVDSALLSNRDPLLKPYLDDQIKRFRKRLFGASSAIKPDERLTTDLQTRLSQLESVYHEVIKWQA